MIEHIVNFGEKSSAFVGLAMAEAKNHGASIGEPIVRCRDCRYAIDLCDGMVDCTGPLTSSWDYYNDEPQQNIVGADGFCAWGEKAVENKCQ